MKKKIVALMIATMMAMSMTACGGSGDTSTKTETKTEAAETTDTSEAEATDQEAEVTYQSILDEYTQKITEAAPGLVEEYNTEAAEKAGDVNALAELSNAKVTKLAEICNEGVEKMAELKIKNGDDDTTDTEWAGKLQAVYTEQSQLITDAYMSSATGQ